MKTLLKFLLLFPLIILASDLDLLYNDSEVAIIEITMDPAGVTWMYDHIDSDSMHLATIHFTNAFIDETIENVGFRLRGNTSRSAQKKSFKVSFNTFEPGRKFYDVEKLNLNGEHNDPSIIRSKLAWDHYQKTNMATTRAAHCALYINGDYYGLYINIEHIDEEFLKNHFEDDSGNLWKCLWPADLSYRGSSPEDYHPYSGDDRPYDLKTNTDAYDFSALAKLITVLHDTPDADLPDSLEAVMVVPEVLKYAAMNVLTGNWDDYWFLRNNYYLYYEPRIERMHFIPYDYDNSFSIDWFDVDWTLVNPYTFITIEATNGNDPGERPLMERVMANTQYRNLFTHILEYYQENITSLGLFESRLDSLRDMLTPWAEIDSFRTLDYGFDNTDFIQSYSTSYSKYHVKKGLKQFINQRHANLAFQIGYDDAPPIIYDLQYWPLIPGPDDSIHVSVAAFSNDGLDSLTIAYHPGALTVVLSYPMHFSPVANPSSIEETDRWVGVIPPMGEFGSGRFQVGAVDNNGASMIYPRSHMVALQVPGGSDSPLRINEILAKNDNVNTDQSGEYDDWLEIYNSGSEALPLSGHYLTDDPNNLTKWMIPNGGVMLGAGGHIIFWCDEDQEQLGLHTNFKLSANGEFLALVAPDGISIIDAFNFGPQQTDVSYGRLQDGGEEWGFFSMPTPGDPNAPSSVVDSNTRPGNFTLFSFPNPFNASTQISYHLPVDGFTYLRILDLNGREVKQLTAGLQNLGKHSLAWNARDGQGNVVPAGIYFVQLQQASHISTRKILLLK